MRIFLVVLAGPFKINDGDLAVRTLAQRAQEFARIQRLHIALALQRLLFRVHRVGDVDRDHQFDVDRNGARAFIGETRIGRGEGGNRQDRGNRAGHAGK
jgi:hypothetical protein